MNAIKLNIILILISGGVIALFPSINKYLLISIGIISLVIIPIANFLKVSSGINNQKIRNSKNNYYYLIVLCLIAAAYLRVQFSSNDTNIKYSGIISFIYIVAIYITIIYPGRIIKNSRNKFEIFNFIAKILSLFCLVNIIFWISGLRNTNLEFAGSGDYNQMLSYFGYSTGRVLFPMSTGVNTYSILAGLVLSIGSIKFIYEKNIKNLSIYVLPSMFSIIMADSRGALLSVFLALVLFFVILRFGWFGMIVVLLGIIVGFLFINSVYSDLFIREGGVTLLTLRELIWISALIELMDFNFNHIFGYGLYGQYSSGISESYSFMFENMENPELAGLHNLYLQLVFDLGYVGAVGVLMVIIYLLRSLISCYMVEKKWQYAASSVSLIFLMIQGFTEVSISIYHPYIIIYLISLYVIIRD